MKNRIKLFDLLGLEISMLRNVIPTFIVLWGLLSAIAILVIGFSPLRGVIFGFIATVFHYDAEIIHQIGHSIAARRTGYPMQGVVLWLILGSSIYPRDEPEDLPPSVHITRALGGPIISFIVTILAVIVALILQDSGGIGFWLAAFVAADNFIIFTVGALTPLPAFVETDGNIILKYWGQS